MSDSQVPLTAPVLLNSIIEPALSAIGLWSPAAGELLLGTAAQESGLRNIRQVDGPALGLFQMEPATHDDIWANYLTYHPTLGYDVALLVGEPRPTAACLLADPQYAAAMARILYRRVSAPLPDYGDVAGYAAYYKRWYNTPQGAATEAEFIANWNRLVAPFL